MTTLVNHLIKLPGLVAALAIAAGLAATLVPAAGPALAYSGDVTTACSGDYHRFCPGYPLNTTQLRRCMQSHGKQLSRACVQALVDSGQISRKALNKR